MPVSSGPVISYVGWFKYPMTRLVRIAPVPMVDYVDAVKQLLEAKSGDKVPKLIRARLGYRIELRDYEPWENAPDYCPVMVDVFGVDWQGNEYKAFQVIIDPVNKVANGSADVTSHYRLPPLVLTPWRIEVSVECQRALLDMDIELYVEWGW